MRTLESAVEAIDTALGGPWKGAVKALFGLKDLTSDADFAEVSSRSRGMYTRC